MLWFMELVQPWQALANVASFMCVYGLTGLLPLALALPVPISDISFSKHLDGPVITTARPHGISGWFRPKLLLIGMGYGYNFVDAVDVKVLNAAQLLISTDLTLLCPGVIDSSQGSCRLTRPGCVVWSSVLGVPVLVAGVLQLLLLGLSTLYFNAQLVLAAPAILLALCMYVHQVSQTRNPLYDRISWYQKQLQKNHLASETGALRAVSLHDIHKFYLTFETFIQKRNMHYIVQNIILPLTQPSKLSFAEMVGPRCGPFFFVSYMWTWEFSTLLTCLDAHAEDAASRYWMNAFSGKQHSIQEELGSCMYESGFYRALSSPFCHGVVAPFPNAAGLRDYLSRSWCLFEIFVAFKHNSHGENDLDRVTFCAPSGALNLGRCSPDLCMECMQIFSDLDLRQAQASSAEDKRMIDAHIEMYGWDEFDRILLRSFRKILESVERLANLHAERVKVDLLLRNFSQLLQRTACDTNSCCPGAERSISARQLDELQNFFASVLDNRDMYWVCDELVKPLTRQKQVSYAELVGCGMVRWFISHWWGMEFNLTVKSILNHAKEYSEFSPLDIRYWVCTFSNNQWKMHEEIPPWAPPSESSFYKALRSPSCLGTCMILDERVVPLCRAWCLFELLQTFLIQDEVRTRESLNILTSSGVLNSGKCSIDTAMAIGKRLTTLNLQDAGASKETDKHLIFTAVETAGGFEAINAKLKQRIRKVIGVVASQFEEDLQRLHVELGKQRAAFC